MILVFPRHAGEKCKANSDMRKVMSVSVRADLAAVGSALETNRCRQVLTQPQLVQGAQFSFLLFEPQSVLLTTATLSWPLEPVRQSLIEKIRQRQQIKVSLRFQQPAHCRVFLRLTQTDFCTLHMLGLLLNATGQNLQSCLTAQEGQGCSRARNSLRSFLHRKASAGFIMLIIMRRHLTGAYSPDASDDFEQ